MNSVVFDASVILAATYQEPGFEKVLQLLPESIAGTVNVSEVQTKLIQKGLAPQAAWLVTLSLTNEVVPFDLQQSEIAGNLASVTQPFGLSFGDRACLALAILRKLPVWTADKSWAKLNLDLEVNLLS